MWSPTNTWCRPAGKQTPGCDARGYIVSGIAGRRTLIEGWAYTNQAMAAQGVGGRRYTEQPSPWPDRVALTNQALAAPTPALLNRLRDEYSVRWLYADARRNGPVSPALDRLPYCDTAPARSGSTNSESDCPVTLGPRRPLRLRRPARPRPKHAAT